MTKKLLTIAVPAYNAAWCLHKCIESFLLPEALPALDIIIVNDGSADETLEIANGYQAQYPASIRVINKENGGHGSGINAAIEAAQGTYFKVIDADDWVVKQSLRPFLNALEHTDADIVLTHFHTVHMLDGTVTPVQMQGVATGCVYSLDELMAAPRSALACCTFHGVCYNTAFYRATGVVLPEKIFYEDQEYATVPFRQAKSILPLDLFLYEYLIGNTEQSVSDQNQVKRLGQLEQVFWRVLQAGGSLDGAARAYFIHKLSDILLSYYTACLIKDPNRREGARKALRMRRQVAGRDGELARATAKEYFVLKTTHMLGFNGGTLEKVKHSKFYQTAHRLMH